MGIFKSLFQKKENFCCNVKIEEVKEDAKDLRQTNKKEAAANANNQIMKGRD